MSRIDGKERDSLAIEVDRFRQRILIDDVDPRDDVVMTSFSGLCGRPSSSRPFKSGVCSAGKHFSMSPDLVHLLDPRNILDSIIYKVGS